MNHIQSTDSFMSIELKELSKDVMELGYDSSSSYSEKEPSFFDFFNICVMCD